MTTALILIDIQNDYFPGGSMELTGSPKAAEAAVSLLNAFREAKRPVVHIQHISTRPGSTFFLPDTKGAQIHPSVAPQEGETIITKHFPNSFRDTQLKQHLESLGVSRLVIAGMMTQMCVDTTVRAAFDLGFNCLLAHDACATRDLTYNGKTVNAQEVQLAYMAALNGLFAKVLSAGEICSELSQV